MQQWLRMAQPWQYEVSHLLIAARGELCAVTKFVVQLPSGQADQPGKGRRFRPSSAFMPSQVQMKPNRQPDQTDSLASGEI